MEGGLGMKTRLVWLGLLCCAFLFSMSLMVSDAAAKADSQPSYTQSMAMPSQTMAVDKTQPQVKPSNNQSDPLEGHTPEQSRAIGDMAVPIQFLSYYRLAFYAFHYSDEAG